MNKPIGERITELRTARKYTVNHLAMLSGVSQSYLREMELGHYSNPSLDVLEAISGALGVSLAELFDEHKELSDTDDSLLEEIELLNAQQREQLRQFLKILRTQPYNQPDTKKDDSMVVKRVIK